MKKRIISLLLVAVMLLSNLPVGAFAADVTEVSDQAGLAAMGDGTYILTADIVLSGWTELSSFSGTLDGNGYTITLSGRPLISTLTGTVKNLILAGQVTETANKNLGALAQNCNGTIRNCISAADVTFSGSSPYVYIGGLAGKVKGTISNCVVTGTVVGGSAACYGAVSNIALFESGTIKNCVAIGSRIASTETRTGGDPFAGTDCTLVADAASFNPSDYLSSLNANRETGDVEWEIVEGSLTLKTVAAAPVQGATPEEIAALDNAVAAAEGVDKTKVYTAESWSVYTSALEAARALQNAAEKKQNKVVEATSALIAAQAALTARSVEPVGLSDKDVISITTADGLEYMQDGKYYRLDADITLGQYWFGYFNTMNSVLDGNGHTVTLIGKPLWSAIGPNGVVQNLGIKGVAQNSTKDTGAFAKDCEGLIVNCWSSVEVNSAGQNGSIKNTGGFVANLKSGGAIVNSYVSGTVSAAGNTGDGKVGVFAGTAAENTLVKSGYWLNTVEANVVGSENGTVTGCATKVRSDFYSDEFLALLNSGKGAYGKSWTVNDAGWPHLGAAGSYVPPQPIELQYTAYEGYGSGTTTFTDAKGLLLPLADVLPDPSAEITYYVGRFSYPGVNGEVAFVPRYAANGQGNHKVFASEDGELQVLGAGSLTIDVYDKASWSGTQYDTKLTSFTVTVSNIEAEQIRMVPSGQYVTDNGDGTYSVAGSATVSLNPEVKVDGVWKSAPSSLFRFTATGAVRQSGSSVYATEPGTMTVTASGLNKSASVTIISTYVPVQSITPAPNGTYVIHGRNANTEGSGQFLDLTLSHDAGTVVVLPENASYRDRWTLTSSDPEIAYYGTSYMMAIIPVKAGTVTLTATSTDPNLATPVTGTSTITLEYYNPLKKVEVSETILTVKENETISLPLTFTGEKDAEGYHVSEPGMIWSFAGDGEVEITRDSLGVIIGEEGSKEYCIASQEYKLVGNSAGTVTVTGMPIDTSGGATPVTFTVTVESGIPETPADNDKIIKEGIAGATDYIENLYKNWQYQYGDEWVVFILTRTGNALTEQEIEHYMDTVAAAYAAPTAEELKPTTIARVILAVSTLGEDPTDVDGIDLIELLCTSNSISAGSNEAIWALIALDCKDHEIPAGAEWTRDKLIAETLKFQNSETGAFGLTDNQTASIDMTAMAIQALAPYYDTNTEAKAAVDKALVWLQQEMDRNCDFGSSEATAQVLIALSALDKDALNADNGFVKSVARNLITAIDAYRCSDGGYKHLLTDAKSNGMAALQALMGYEAYRRCADDENALYDLMGDSSDGSQTPGNPGEGSEEPGAAAPGSVEIYVTIAVKGAPVMTMKKITVTDVNCNGFFDVDDALRAAHDVGYTGGVAAGYATNYSPAYGLSIAKLWGDTSYSYGYWLNNASCWSLEDTVKADDHLVAFVYTDGTGWSDCYAKFDKFDFVTTATEGLTVKLEKAGYDENWNTVFTAHSGATITLYDENGKALTEGYTVKDHHDGTYTVIVNTTGNYYVVATGNDPILVPAVASVIVNQSTETSRPGDSSIPQTGDNTNVMLYATIMIPSLACMAVLLLASKKKNVKYNK